MGSSLRKTGQKNNAEPKIKFSVYGGEKGIRTPDTVFTVYMISNHAPSASSDISPLRRLLCVLRVAKKEYTKKVAKVNRFFEIIPRRLLRLQ